jgi:hypothetical protein
MARIKRENLHCCLSSSVSNKREITEAIKKKQRAISVKIYKSCRFSRLLSQKPAFSALICRLLRRLFAAYCAKPDLCCRLLRQSCKADPEETPHSLDLMMIG